MFSACGAYLVQRIHEFQRIVPAIGFTSHATSLSGHLALFLIDAPLVVDPRYVPFPRCRGWQPAMAPLKVLVGQLSLPSPSSLDHESRRTHVRETLCHPSVTPIHRGPDPLHGRTFSPPFGFEAVCCPDDIDPLPQQLLPNDIVSIRTFH